MRRFQRRIFRHWPSLTVALNRRYAVFTHRDHIAAIRRTWFTIWNKWLPESGHQVAEAAEFERYGEEVDPRTGTGGLEIWIPIQC